jgi:hypothetical protein
VVREDPLLAAWHPSARSELGREPVAGTLHAGEELESTATAIMEADTPEELVAKDVAGRDAGTQYAVPPVLDLRTSGGEEVEGLGQAMAPGGGFKDRAGVGIDVTQPLTPHSREQLMADNLAQLQKLPWRRVDVCFRGANFPLLAHQHLQVQRHWLNGAGFATVKHMTLQLVAMEEMRVGQAQSDASS